MKYTVSNRTNCRLCSSNNLTQFMRFDHVPFFDEVVTEDIRGQEFCYPMELYFCNDCASVQTQHDVNLLKYYKSYQYVASNSKFIRDYMSQLVTYCSSHLGLHAGDKVIEVGSADGYLLSLFEEAGANALGFEAAQNLCDIASKNKVNVINELFTRDSLDLIPTDFRKVHFLILLHTFDHLYDPCIFLDTASEVLDPKCGVLILEVHDLADIYVKHETALFGHEHATYLHYNSMKRLLDRHKLRMIDFNFLDKAACRGSSMLIAATPQDSELIEKPGLASFENNHLDDLLTFLDFDKSVSESFAHLRKYIEKGKKKGKKYVGYGGWGRGVTTLAMAGLNANHLDFVVDGNQSLHGCYTPVTEFLIKGPAAIKRDAVDEVIVFNYAYIEEIKNGLQEYIENGGKVISVIDLLKASN